MSSDSSEDIDVLSPSTRMFATKCSCFANDINEPNTSRTKILEASIAEFNESSFDAASITQIAMRAGVSRSLVTYHFPTKSSIASAILGLAYQDGVFMGRDRDATD